MSILTDELIEKVATAIELCDKPYSSEYLARAALSAILPDVIEECAKVAEAYECGSEGWDCGAIAPRIRSLLKEKEIG